MNELNQSDVAYGSGTDHVKDDKVFMKSQFLGDKMPQGNKMQKKVSKHKSVSRHSEHR